MAVVHAATAFTILSVAGLTAQTATQYFTPAQPIAELNAGGGSNFSPTISEDELYIVFASTRAGGLGGYDLYESHRAGVDDAWGPPVNIAVLNSSANEYEPTLSFDGLELYFVSTRAGGLGPSDIYLSTRPAIGAVWGPPVNIGAPINGPGIANDDPNLTKDGLTMFFTGPGAGGADVWTSTRAAIGSPWNPPTPFAAVNGSDFDHSPLPEGNGEIVWFSSNRSGGAGGSSDFYMTTKDPVSGLYSAPVEIDDMNTSDWDSNACRGCWTHRMYVSQFVGADALLKVACPRLPVLWLKHHAPSQVLPQDIPWSPPPARVAWRRVWEVSIQEPQVHIAWYNWLVYQGDGFSFLLASVAAQDPPIPASSILPGGEGAVLISPPAESLRVTQLHPGQTSGLEVYTVQVPLQPGLIGVEVHFQSASIDLGNNLLNLSEGAILRLAP